MAARKKGPPRVGDEADPSEKPVKKPTPLGPELALTLPTTQGKALELSYWDLWFALVAVTVHDGDLDPVMAAVARGDTASATAHLARLDAVLAGQAATGPDMQTRLRARGSILAISEVLT